MQVWLRSAVEGEDDDLDVVNGVNRDDLHQLQSTLVWADVVCVGVSPCQWLQQAEGATDENALTSFMAVLRQCRSLVTLELAGDPDDERVIGGDELEALSAVLPALTNLRNLDLSGHGLETEWAPLFDVLPHCPSLARLDLSDNLVDHDDMADLWTALQTCTHIQDLQIDNNMWVLRNAEIPVPSADLGLTRLALNGVWEVDRDDDEAVTWQAGVLRRCPSLASLELRGNIRLDGADMVRFAAALGTCTRLTSLDISGNLEGTMPWCFEVLPRLPRLRELKLAMHFAQSTGPAYFHGLVDVLGRCTALSSLDLSHNFPGQKYPALLRALRRNCPLQELTITHTGLGSHFGFLELILPFFVHLRKLRVAKNGLSDAEVARLRARRSPTQQAQLAILA